MQVHFLCDPETPSLLNAATPSLFEHCPGSSVVMIDQSPDPVGWHCSPLRLGGQQDITRLTTCSARPLKWKEQASSSLDGRHRQCPNVYCWRSRNCVDDRTSNPIS